jgi:transposase
MRVASINIYIANTEEAFGEKADSRILFLPPYSPDLNPIEKYWANMKAKVRELLPKVKNFTEALERPVLSM